MSPVFPGFSQLLCAPEDLSCNYIVLLLYLESDSLSSFILVKEADEGLKYEGRKANFVARNSTYKIHASKGEQLGQVSQAAWVTMVFCRETVLAKGIICKTETKTAKVSVTAVICHKIQCLETVHFVSLLEGREEERHNKQSPKWIILRSSVFGW